MKPEHTTGRRSKAKAKHTTGNARFVQMTNDKHVHHEMKDKFKENVAHSPKKSNNGLAHIVMQIQKHQRQVGMKMYLLLVTITYLIVTY